MMVRNGYGLVRSDLVQGVLLWPAWMRMAWQDVQLRYRRSILGPFWISLSLSLLILTLAFLYSQVFNQEFRSYLSFLAAGLLIWTLIAGMINEACSLGAENEVILRNAPVPMTALSLRLVFRSLIEFSHNIVAVLLILLLFGSNFHWTIVSFPFAVALYAVLGFFVGLLLGPLATRFRDLTQILANFLQIAFFLTPIIWSPSQITGRTLFVDANPFYHLIEIVRAPLTGRGPDPTSWIVSVLIVAATAMAALLFLPHARRRLYFWL